ncbi:MAG: prephenate dehydrogenase/arogenate dehydrogenase family protein [Acidimicrobiia bacterium]|nr:prephenate dehydrogenase/arogenate dehydrogenase family protein [Acidimicrobiia bacterium]
MTVRVALIGCGLVGGSVGLALAAAEGYEVVAAFDPAPDRAMQAVAAGAARRAAASAAAAAEEAEMIVVAVPVSSIAPAVEAALPGVAPGAVITDVGSVKGPVVRRAVPLVPPGVHFVGGHPMAGSEQHGFEAATAGLFVNACWAITPTAESDPEAVAAVHRLASATGAAPLTLDPDVHDAVVAVVSHLPQVASSSLMNVASRHAAEAPPVLRMAAGGFRDMTRIAAGDPHVWEDILHENASAVRAMLDDYSDALAEFRDSLDDRERLRVLLARAQAGRHALPVSAEMQGRHAVVVVVTDAPGVFADVTTAVGEAGVNIVDVELRHSPEGGGGLLTLDVVGAGAAETARAVLAAKGYPVHTEELAE